MQERSSNNALQAELTNGYGIRPAVILNSNVWILSGNGQKGNPYIIDGDKSFGQKSELLSNRLSGEYILFNNVKYRIVGVENGLTKVTMADYDLNKNSINTSLAFGADVSQIRFSPTYGIGLYLENWYKATSENDTNKIYSNIYINSTYKDMIATSDADEVVWYVGPDTGGTQYDYEKSKTGTPVSATIGMGRYGELFSSQFGEGGNTSITYTWLITKHISSLLWRLNNNGGVYSFAPTKELAVRPSFYLKADVKLGDVDGDGDIGTGMPHDPYEIVQ